MDSSLLEVDGGSQLPAWLFEAAAAGVQVSGDSGFGKSVLLEQLARVVAASGDAGLLLIDPPGDLAKNVLAACLKMGRKVRDRIPTTFAQIMFPGRWLPSSWSSCRR